MSERANPMVIGGFVVGAVLLFVVGIVVFSKGPFWIKKPTRVLYFEGSVAGLDVGAPVNFRGVRIGTVSKILLRINFENKLIRTPVYIEIDPDRILEVKAVAESAERQELVQELIQRGLRGQLVLQSLITGQLAVELDMHPDTPVKLVGGDSEVLEIPTIPSGIQELKRRFEKLQLDKLVNSLLRTVQSIDQAVHSPELKKVISGLDEALVSIRNLAQNIDSRLEPLLSSLEDTSKAARLTFEESNEMVSGVKHDLHLALNDIQKLIQNIDNQIAPLAESIDQTSKTARSAFEESRSTLSKVNGIADENSPERYEIKRALKELSAAARSIRNLARYLERNPNALVYGKRKSGGN
jgi:paraquat-inducible protein B